LRSPGLLVGAFLLAGSKLDERMKKLLDRYPKPLVVGVLMVGGTVVLFFIVLALGLLTDPDVSRDSDECRVGTRGGITWEQCERAAQAAREPRAPDTEN
jgi:hypothetical protein